MLFLFSMAPITVHAQTKQRQIIRQQLLWQTWNETIEFNPKWSLRAELIAREFYEPYSLHQRAGRLRLHYKLNTSWNVSGGFALFLQQPNDPSSTSDLAVPELRPHLEAAYQGNFGKFTITHRYRAEQRFIRNSSGEDLVNGYTSNFRFRYRLGFEYVLLKDSKERPLKLKVSEEILLNAGKNIQYNVFDNNRISVSLNYELPRNFSIELGYLNWIQQNRNGYQFYYRDIITFSIFHKITFKAKTNAN